MASAVITRDAYKLAGDPSKFPEQIKEGLRPWQPRKLYHSAGFGFPGEPATTGKVTRVNSGDSVSVSIASSATTGARAAARR